MLLYVTTCPISLVRILLFKYGWVLIRYYIVELLNFNVTLPNIRVSKNFLPFWPFFKFRRALASPESLAFAHALRPTSLHLLRLAARCAGGAAPPHHRRRTGLVDNPTINSSIVRYDSNCSHKPSGTSKPNFSSPKGYLPSITSIRKI